MFFDVFLNVLAVLGIIALGAFIIVFLSDLLISVIDNSNGIFFRRKKGDVREEEPQRRPKMLPAVEEPAPQITYQEQKPQSQPQPQPQQQVVYPEQQVMQAQQMAQGEESFDGIDYEKAREEEALIRKPAQQKQAVDAKKNAERLRIIEQRRREYEEAQREQQKLRAEVEEEDNVTEKDIDSIIAEVSKESKKELEKEQAKAKAEAEAKAKAEEEAKAKAEAEAKAKAEEEARAKAEAEKAEKERLIAERQAKEQAAEQARLAAEEKAKKEREELASEIAALKQQLKDAHDNVASLTKQIEETPTETIVKGALSREELEERLVVLRQRLKENQKELSVNKKDYMPLKRVHATLESDKKKLRRKEAIVAKQKVLLYGVNNYVDIDEEKAKKLAEELDLLEGLRLSVQHCEEVMAANKDRFPILEKTNKILKKNIEDIESDIARYEQELANFEDSEEVEAEVETDEVDDVDDVDDTDIDVDTTPDVPMEIDIDAVINSIAVDIDDDSTNE